MEEYYFILFTFTPHTSIFPGSRWTSAARPRPPGGRKSHWRSAQARRLLGWANGKNGRAGGGSFISCAYCFAFLSFSVAYFFVLYYVSFAPGPWWRVVAFCVGTFRVTLLASFWFPLCPFAIGAFSPRTGATPLRSPSAWLVSHRMDCTPCSKKWITLIDLTRSSRDAMRRGILLPRSNNLRQVEL